MKRSTVDWVLGVALVLYVIFNILLTPPAGLETRNPALVTGIGVVSLALLFIGLALAIVAIVLVYRRSRRAAGAAIIAASLFVPAFLVEQTGNFSTLRPPPAIEAIEIVQAALVVIIVAAGFWRLRRSAST